MTVKAAPVWDGDLSDIPTSILESDGKTVIVPNGMTLRNELSEKYKITIADGATVTLADVTINGVNNEIYNWAGITSGDNSIIILDGTNTVKGFYEDYPGIYVPENKTLTIKGTGSLTASPFDGGRTNGSFGAGIGGGNDINCGNIIIEGGTITATGGEGAAGIGAGMGSGVICGTITISGGSVSATGGQNAAGIGSGITATCGNILIQGGTVEATGKDGGAGIGSGGDYGGNGADCGTVTITTGVIKVTATKGSNAPNSIGAGNSGTCGTVTIGCTLNSDGNPVDGTPGPITQSPYTYQP